LWRNLFRSWKWRIPCDLIRNQGEYTIYKL